jgi:hypothetical protein
MNGLIESVTCWARTHHAQRSGEFPLRPGGTEASVAMGDPRSEAQVALDVSLLAELDEQAGSFFVTVAYVHKARRLRGLQRECR